MKETKIEIKISIPESEYSQWEEFERNGIKGILKTLKKDYEDATDEMGISNASVYISTDS